MNLAPNISDILIPLFLCVTPIIIGICLVIRALKKTFCHCPLNKHQETRRVTAASITLIRGYCKTCGKYWDYTLRDDGSNDS